jgi:hypothetical protein
MNHVQPGTGFWKHLLKEPEMKKLVRTADSRFIWRDDEDIEWDNVEVTRGIRTAPVALTTNSKAVLGGFNDHRQACVFVC